MPENLSYNSWKFEPETKDYRKALAEALNLAYRYDGTEKKYRELMNCLIEFEELVKNSPSLTAEENTKETEAALKFAPDHPHDIQEILEIAVKSRNKNIEKIIETSNESGFEQEELPPLFIIKVPGVLLPTIPEPLPEPGSGTFEERKIEPRLQELLSILESIGVFSDDVIITLGKTDHQMVRRTSYALVRIPRLNRSVLVCNEVGEATFIINGDVSTDEILNSTKDDLLINLGSRIKKIIRSTHENWENSLRSLLGSDEEWENNLPQAPRERNKIDIRSFYSDDILNKIRNSISSPENWINMPSREKDLFRIEGLTLTRLSRLFEIEGDARGQAIAFYKLGLIIWPENEKIKDKLKDSLTTKEILEKAEARTKEQWREIISNEYTPEQWVNMKLQERLTFSIDECHLDRLGNIFGIEKRSIRAMGFLKLGLAIWPGNELIEERLIEAIREEIEKTKVKTTVENLSLEEWRKRISEKFTPETWAKIDADKRKNLNIDGVGLVRLGRIFGFTGNTRNDFVEFIKLGLAIWPQNEYLTGELKKAEKQREARALTEEGLKESIKAEFSPETWIKMTHDQKRALRIKELGLHAIGTKFGMKENHLPSSPLHFLELGLKIWPENDKLIVRLAEIKRKTNFEK